MAGFRASALTLHDLVYWRGLPFFTCFFFFSGKVGIDKDRKIEIERQIERRTERQTQAEISLSPSEGDQEVDSSYLFSPSVARWSPEFWTVG